MKKYDVLTLAGLVGGVILLAGAIILAGSFAGAKIFFSLSSFITVMGGLTASIIVNYSIKDLKVMVTSLSEAFFEKEYNIAKLVEIFVDLSVVARREGLLALENKVQNIEDPFIKKGILLTVDGLEAGVIKEILMAEVVAVEEKKSVGIRVLERAGELAPAWGMIGTLIGLILMLQNLDEPSTLGPAMALALITTFYGAVLANLFFIPLAGKIENRTEYELYIKQIMVEGILGVQSGQNPKLLREKLEVFIDDKQVKKKATGTVMDEEVAF